MGFSSKGIFAIVLYLVMPRSLYNVKFAGKSGIVPRLTISNRFLLGAYVLINNLQPPLVAAHFYNFSLLLQVA